MPDTDKGEPFRARLAEWLRGRQDLPLSLIAGCLVVVVAALSLVVIIRAVKG